MIPDILYLDYNATTPVSPEVREAMMPFLDTGWFNPSAAYRPAQSVRAAVDRARVQTAAMLECTPDEIVFTSGATESCNIAIFGAVAAAAGRRAHLVTVATEHHAVLNAMKAAEARGCEVTYLPVDSRGRIRMDDFLGALRPNTVLVSMMRANNETGVLHDVVAAGSICRERGILFHCDATAAMGKMPVHPGAFFCDLLSLSAHKFYGPKGVGALFVRHGVKIHPLAFGGEQEHGIRPGTENVAGIVALGVAAEHVGRFVASGGPARIVQLRNRIAGALRVRLDGHKGPGPVEFMGTSPDAADSLCNTLSLRVPGIRNEDLVMALDREGICISAGSACSSGATLSSHVIRAMGHPEGAGREVVRVSLGEGTTEKEIDRFVETFTECAFGMLRPPRPTLSGSPGGSAS